MWRFQPWPRVAQLGQRHLRALRFGRTGLGPKSSATKAIGLVNEETRSLWMCGPFGKSAGCQLCTSTTSCAQCFPGKAGTNWELRCASAGFVLQDERCAFYLDSNGVSASVPELHEACVAWCCLVRGLPFRHPGLARAQRAAGFPSDGLTQVTNAHSNKNNDSFTRFSIPTTKLACVHVTFLQICLAELLVVFICYCYGKRSRFADWSLDRMRHLKQTYVPMASVAPFELRRSTCSIWWKHAGIDTCANCIDGSLGWLQANYDQLA